MAENSFTVTHERNAVLAEILARAPAGADLGGWVRLLGKIVTAFQIAGWCGIGILTARPGCPV